MSLWGVLSILVGLAVAVTLLFWWTIGGALLSLKIKYWGAPTGCCQTWCQRCPWGNRKYAGYKKETLEYIARRGCTGYRPWLHRIPGDRPYCEDES